MKPERGPRKRVSLQQENVLEDLTAALVRELFNYDPDTGDLTWAAPRSRRVKVGDVVGARSKTAYVQVGVGRKVYVAHRVIWLWVHGELPQQHIDHRDGNTRNNRLANLRLADKSENAQNMALKKSNTSGFLGVSLCRHTNRWRAYITINRKTHKLGRFSTPEAAHQAYLAAKAKLHTFQPTPRTT